MENMNTIIELAKNGVDLMSMSSGDAFQEAIRAGKAKAIFQQILKELGITEEGEK